MNYFSLTYLFCISVLFLGCGQAENLDLRSLTRDQESSDEGASLRNGTYNTEETNVGALYNTDNGGVCSGTLIRPDVVLTAAHCIYHLILDPSKGANFRFSNASDIGLSKKKLAKHFANKPYAKAFAYKFVPPHARAMLVSDMEEDLALVKLSSAKTGIKFNKNLANLPLSYLDDPSLNLVKGDLVKAVGYGLDVAKDGKADEFVGQRQSAKIVYAKPEFRNPLVFKPNAKNQISCPGDSGSPIFMKGFIVGVLSAGSTRNSKNMCVGMESVYYASIARNRNWLVTNLEKFGYSEFDLDPTQNFFTLPLDFASLDVSNKYAWKKETGKMLRVNDEFVAALGPAASVYTIRDISVENVAISAMVDVGNDLTEARSAGLVGHYIGSGDTNTYLLSLDKKIKNGVATYWVRLDINMFAYNSKSKQSEQMWWYSERSRQVQAPEGKGLLELSFKDSRVTASFNGQPMFGATEYFLTEPGRVGIRATNGAKISSFSAAAN